MKTLTYMVMVYALLLPSIGYTYAQKVFEQGISITEINGSYSITCFSEPVHPSGVNGDITIIADRPYSRTLTFTPGDSNYNGVEDNSATLIFPDDFNANYTQDFTVLCNMWSGSDRDEEGAYSSITAEFWQSIYTDGSVRFRQGLIMPESIHPGGSIDIVCFSEPAHGTNTVDGIIIVKIPDERTYFKSREFIKGDIDGNGVSDDYTILRFPDDFTSYPPADTNTMGEYTVFCDLTNGTRDAGGVVLHTGEFLQAFWVSFHVIPEGIVGTLLLLCSSIMVLVLYGRRVKG
ncbi:hypothetical protein HRbin05_00256 [archaeon HR05]|nr:hypothetical protein HRbin05_00256 [archaeon HR05]